MPVEKVKGGYRWGKTGKVFPTKEEAEAQGRAIKAQQTKDSSSMFIKDRVNINSQRTYTDEGFLVVPARIARTGIQEYLAFEMGLQDRDPTETVRVFRPTEEVFSQSSLEPFTNKPVTDNHPTELVDSTNAKKLSVGHSGPEVTQDGIFASTILHITDAEAIKKIEDGKVELSNGYTSDIEWTAGVTSDGDEYDAIQRNIKGNHIALVDKGRCGPACKVSDNSPTNVKKEPNMATVNIDGVDFEVSDQAAQAVRKLHGRVEDAEKKAEDQEEEMKKKEDQEEKMKKDHQASLDTLQAELDDAAAKAPTPEQLDALVENRISTRDAAIKIKPDLKWEGKDCETIRKEIIADKCTDVDVEKVSPDYIRARFDALASTAPTQTQSSLDNAFSKQVTNTSSNDDDQNKDTVKDARTKMADEYRNAWKSGGSK